MFKWIFRKILFAGVVVLKLSTLEGLRLMAYHIRVFRALRGASSTDPETSDWPSVQCDRMTTGQYEDRARSNPLCYRWTWWLQTVRSLCRFDYYISCRTCLACAYGQRMREQSAIIGKRTLREFWRTFMGDLSVSNSCWSRRQFGAVDSHSAGAQLTFSMAIVNSSGNRRRLPAPGEHPFSFSTSHSTNSLILPLRLRRVHVCYVVY